MPIFEYRCEACGEKLETLVRRDADIPTECPSCGAKGSMKKQFSTFSAGVGGSSAPSCADGSCSMPASCPTGSCCPSGTCGL